MKSIIELAREAGFHKWYTQPREHPDHVAVVARFAALVRSQTLEEAAVVCIETGSIKGSCDAEFDMVDACAAAIRQLKDKS